MNDLFDLETTLILFSIFQISIIFYNKKYRVRLLGKASFRKRERERLEVLARKSNASVRVQSWWRGMMLRFYSDTTGRAKKLQRRRIVRRCVKKIQSVGRMYMAGKYVKSVRRRKNATDIQRVWRGMLGRMSALDVLNRHKARIFLHRMQNQKLCACFNRWVEQIDKLLRCRVLVKKCFGSILMYCVEEWKFWLLLREMLKRKSAKDIQRAWRARCLRVQHWAATKLQGLWRARNAREEVMLARRAKKKQEKKIATQLKRLKFRLLIKILLALERNAIQCKRVKSLAMRCMQSSTRVFFMKMYHHYVWRRGLRVAASLLLQKRYRGWKGRLRAKKYNLIKKADRLRRNERVVAAELKLRRRRRHAHWCVARWWRRSLLRWRAPMYLAWQRKYSATELQRIVRGYLGRGYAFHRWKTFTAAAKTIQRYFRGWLGRREAARQRTSIALQRAAILIQRAYRRRRAHLMKNEMMKKEINATIEIQRVWRGHGGRDHSRERRWELHLEHLRSFSAKVQQVVGAAPSGQRNQKALIAVRMLQKRIQTNKRMVRNRLAKMKVLEMENVQAKNKCDKIVQILLNHRLRIRSITEGIFQDSVKRTDLVDMHRFLVQHRDKLKKGMSDFHEKLRLECSMKQLLSPKDFDDILDSTLGVDAPAKDAAPFTKLIKLPPSAWSKSRALARKRDEPPPENELPLDNDGSRIHPPPPVPFQWPFLSAYHDGKGSL